MAQITLPTKANQKTVHTFGWASFLNDVGANMIYPIWPMFVTVVLGAPPSVLGFIDGLSDAVVSISQAVSGYVSDRIRKRKIFIWLGYLFGAISRFGYATAAVWHMLVPFRVLDRIGKMRGSPRDAMVAEISTDKDRAGNFGYMNAMDNLGAVFGVILSIVLLPVLSFRPLFLLAVVPSLVAAGLIYFRVREKKPAGRIFHGLEWKNLSASFVGFLIVSALFAVASFSYSFLLLFARDFGVAATSIPFLFLLFTIVASWASSQYGKLANRFGRRSVFALAMCSWLLICLALLFSRNVLVLIAVFGLYGFHLGALDPVQKTLAAELAPTQMRASAIGLYQMIVGLCAFPASFIAGLLWDGIGMHATLLFSMGLTVAALLLMPLIRIEK